MSRVVPRPYHSSPVSTLLGNPRKARRISTLTDLRPSVRVGALRSMCARLIAGKETHAVASRQVPQREHGALVRRRSDDR